MFERIKEDMIQAMKAKDKERLDVIRMVKANIDQVRIDQKKDIDDALCLDVINKQIKMRNDSIVEFAKGKRDDLINKTKSEIAILTTYLPKQLSDLEVKEILDKVFDEVKPEGSKDMGKIMATITPLVKGKTDMKRLSILIKERLASKKD